MASSKVSNLVDLAGAQVPTDLFYVVDVSAGAAGSKKSTLNDVFATITKNITDGAVRFQEVVAPAASAVGEGAIYFDSTSNTFKVSENSGAYFDLGNIRGPSPPVTDNAIVRFDGVLAHTIQQSSITIDDTGAFGLPDNVRQTFNPGANNAGLNVGAIAGDPSAPSNGDLWYDSTGNLLRARINGATVSLGAGGGSTPGGADTQVQFNNAGAFGGVSGFTSDGTNVTAGSGNLRATRPRFITSIDDTNGNEVFIITATGSAVNEFTVANAATGGNPTISTSGGDTDIPFVVAPKGTGRFESTGPLRLSGSGTDTFTTPKASGVPTKINIPLFSPGGFGQILAFGLASAAPDSARVLSLFDERSSSGHQPTLQVFNPNEDSLFGLTWAGSDAIAQVFTDQILQLSGIRVFQKMPASAPTDADIPNSFLSIYIDEGANNLIIRTRDSGGTLQTATIALV